MRIHTSVHCMEIGQIFHKKFFFSENGLDNFFLQFPSIRNNNILIELPICKASSEENGIGQYPVVPCSN